jgi:HAE1 family hydrophobic/amphiphilic exporter-1
MLIALTSEDGRYDQQFLGNYALINIKDTLARIRGIGRVNVIGASDYSMRIWIKPDLLANNGNHRARNRRRRFAPRASSYPAASSGPNPLRRERNSPTRSDLPERLQI